MIQRRKWLKRSWLNKKARRRKELWRTGRVMEDAAGMAVLREAAYDRAEGNCEVVWEGVRCNKFAPREGIKKGDLIHKVFRSHGGSDTLENVEWGCRECHVKRDHPGPQWSKHETTGESRQEPSGDCEGSEAGRS